MNIFSMDQTCAQALLRDSEEALEQLKRLRQMFPLEDNENPIAEALENKVNEIAVKLQACFEETEGIARDILVAIQELEAEKKAAEKLEAEKKAAKQVLDMAKNTVNKKVQESAGTNKASTTQNSKSNVSSNMLGKATEVAKAVNQASAKVQEGKVVDAVGQMQDALSAALSMLRK